MLVWVTPPFALSGRRWVRLSCYRYSTTQLSLSPLQRQLLGPLLSPLLSNCVFCKVFLYLLQGLVRPCCVLLFFSSTTHVGCCLVHIYMYQTVAPSLPSKRENPPYPCDGLIYCPSHSSFLLFLSFIFLWFVADSLSLCPAPSLALFKFCLVVLSALPSLPLSFPSSARICEGVVQVFGYLVVVVESSCALLSSLPLYLSLSSTMGYPLLLVKLYAPSFSLSLWCRFYFCSPFAHFPKVGIFFFYNVLWISVL